ncbi:MAG: hypothetical protein NTU41_04435 [Chloroflexi bacterium]|nr:hypothetical protein [Chloroflexota bacterium]
MALSLEMTRMTKEEAEKGSSSLETLVRIADRIVEKRGIEALKNDKSLRSQWLYIQSL